MPGIKSEQIRKEMLEIVQEGRPGSMLAIVKGGFRVLEYDAVGPEQRVLDDSRRGLALQLFDSRKVIHFLYFITYSLIDAHCALISPKNLPNFSPLFSLFLWQFDPFSPFLYCLVNYGYISKNYTVRLFHPVHLLEFGVLPPCAFILSCVFIKIG